MLSASARTESGLMRIRPATVADLPHFVPLMQQSIAYQQQMSSCFDLAPHIDWGHLAQMKLQNSHEQVLVAEQDAQLVGYIDVRTSSHPLHYRVLRYLRGRFLRRRLMPLTVRPHNV